MPRRHIPKFLAAAIALLAVLTANATDFWLTKDWRQWSKGDCENLLAESPWVHTWRGGGPAGDQLAFAVQLRSALPIRQAIVRQLQFDQKYENMTDAQRTTFDAQATQILNRNYDDAILVHVDYSKGLGAPYLPFAWFPTHSDTAILDPSLVTDDGTRISSSRFDSKTNYTFDLIFPRTKDGVPLIKDGQKHFSIQFHSPQITNNSQGITVPARNVGVEFDLGKMTIDGKISY
jgi:hypothetical protein